MKAVPTLLNRVASSLTVATLLCLTIHARAQVTYYVDPLQSSLTLSVAFQGAGWDPYPVTAQVSGALSDSFGGTIVANVSGGGLTFGGGSFIQALPNPNGPFHPSGADVGGPWSGVDNYGGQADVFGYRLWIAHRDLILDITAGSASVAGDPASGMSLGFIGGKMDWSMAILGAGASTPTGSWLTTGGVNASPGNVTLSPDSSKLTIPVVLSTTSWHFNGVNFNETWSGTIVAVVPEPSSLALAGLGLAASVLLKARRGQRS